MYYKCTADLWSLYIPNQLKFSKDEIYESIDKDVYINNQGNRDAIRIEGWQRFFEPIDIDSVNIEEIEQILQEELITV